MASFSSGTIFLLLAWVTACAAVTGRPMMTDVYYQDDQSDRENMFPASAQHYSYWDGDYGYPGHIGGGGGLGGGHGGGYGGGDGFGGIKPNHKALALKALLVPLAGVALLGAAATFISNPILLQLGVVTGKRRRRSSNDLDPQAQEKLHEITLLEKFMANLPDEQLQQEKLMASYLSCTGMTSGNNTCLERLTCELNDPKSGASQLEKEVMGIVTYNILNNKFVPERVKQRVHSAAQVGAEKGNCKRYHCQDLQ